MHLLATSYDETRRDRRSGRPRPTARRHRVLSSPTATSPASPPLGQGARRAAERAARASARLAPPMSVDLWIDRVGAHAKVIVVRLLGGLDWWKYGIERLSALARERGIVLAVVPGEDRDEPASPRPRPYRRGARRLLDISAKAAGRTCGLCCAGRPRMPDTTRKRANPSLCRASRVSAGRRCGRTRPADRFARAGQSGRADYLLSRMLLSSDTAPIDALCAALTARGLAPAALVMPSLKEPRRLHFSATRSRGSTRRDRHHDGVRRRQRRREPTPLDVQRPVLQVVSATTNARLGATAPAGLAPPILRCTSSCPSLMAAFSRALSLSRIRCRRRKVVFHCARQPARADRIAMVANRIAAIVRCADCRVASAASPS